MSVILPRHYSACIGQPLCLSLQIAWQPFRRQTSVGVLGSPLPLFRGRRASPNTNTIGKCRVLKKRRIVGVYPIVIVVKAWNDLSNLRDAITVFSLDYIFNTSCQWIFPCKGNNVTSNRSCYLYVILESHLLPSWLTAIFMP